MTFIIKKRLIFIKKTTQTKEKKNHILGVYSNKVIKQLNNVIYIIRVYNKILPPVADTRQIYGEDKTLNLKQLLKPSNVADIFNDPNWLSLPY